jgi:hypothetical protein
LQAACAGTEAVCVVKGDGARAAHGIAAEFDDAG